MHLIGLALLVGTIVLLDLVVLGWISIPDVHLDKWTRHGFAVMFLTGPVMFFSDVTRYTHNGAFLVKMGLLAAALVFHFTIQLRGRKWAALLSLALWSAVVVCGRLIADFDV